MQDPVIIKYATELSGSLINDSPYAVDRKANIRKELRILGRYLEVFRDVTKNKLNLADTFDIKYRNSLVVVVKKIASEFSHPHPLKKLHHTLGMVINNKYIFFVKFDIA